MTYRWNTYAFVFFVCPVLFAGCTQSFAKLNQLIKKAPSREAVIIIPKQLQGWFGTIEEYYENRPDNPSKKKLLDPYIAPHTDQYQNWSWDNGPAHIIDTRSAQKVKIYRGIRLDGTPSQALKNLDLGANYKTGKEPGMFYFDHVTSKLNIAGHYAKANEHDIGESTYLILEYEIPAFLLEYDQGAGEFQYYIPKSKLKKAGLKSPAVFTTGISIVKPSPAGLPAKQVSVKRKLTKEELSKIIERSY